MRKMIGCVLLFSLFGCSNKNGYQTIHADDALSKIKQNVHVIDVREPDEYAEGHIQDSVNVPLGTIEKDIDAVVSDKTQEIIVYCRSGARSKQASNKLLAQGYTNVFDLGGILNWPYDVIK